MGNLKQNRIRKYLLIHYELNTKGLWDEHGFQMKEWGITSGILQVQNEDLGKFQSFIQIN